jgi:antagonist of KipI
MSIRVESPGLLTTVQDLGRGGYQRYGVSVGGAMDGIALRMANALVGNHVGAAALEVTVLGPTLTFLDSSLFALVGGDLGAELNGERVPSLRPCVAARGATLAFRGARAGCRAYLAVAGGLDVPAVLGSRSTDLTAGIGGMQGRALARGDVLPIGTMSVEATSQLDRLTREDRRFAHWAAARYLQSSELADPVVRVVAGPEFDWLTEGSRTLLFDSRFRIGMRSDRMGYRLEGARLDVETPGDMISSPVTLGTLQLPPSGEPIVLMADRQTVGGYPRIAHVAAADLSLLAQLAPGASLRFRRVDLADAQGLDRAQQRKLACLIAGTRASLH